MRKILLKGSQEKEKYFCLFLSFCKEVESDKKFQV